MNIRLGFGKKLLSNVGIEPGSFQLRVRFTLPLDQSANFDMNSLLCLMPKRASTLKSELVNFLDFFDRNFFFLGWGSYHWVPLKNTLKLSRHWAILTADRRFTDRRQKIY